MVVADRCLLFSVSEHHSLVRQGVQGLLFFSFMNRIDVNN
jgi:hypothetical protein